MTPRERVLAALRGEDTGQVPWFGDLSYWVDSLRTRGELPEVYQGDGIYRLHRDLGVGFYLQGYFPWTAVTEGETVEETRSGDRQRRTIRNPAGLLVEERVYLPQTFSWAHSKWLITGPEDYPAWRWHLTHTRLEPDYAEASRRRGLIGDMGVLLCYLPRSAFMELVTEITGLQNLIYLLQDYPEETQELLRAMGELAESAADIALASPAECLMIPENLSAEMVGRELYTEWLRPYERRWVERIRGAGKYSFIHMDGTLRGLVGEVAATGFDVLEALTPVPSGDLTAAEIAAVLPSTTVFWGGLPGIVFTPHVSDADFERHVRETVEVMRERGRCVLGVADQVPPDGSWERVRAVARIVGESRGG